MNDVLLISLEAMVPLRILEVRSWPFEQRASAARAAADVIAAHGDDLQYGGKHTAEAWGALVTGLACAAYMPGGIKFAGLRFVACDRPAEYVVDRRVLCVPCTRIAEAAGGTVRPEPVEGDGSTPCQGAVL